MGITANPAALILIIIFICWILGMFPEGTSVILINAHLPAHRQIIGMDYVQLASS